MAFQKPGLVAASKIDFRLVHAADNPWLRLQWRWLVVALVIVDLVMISSGFFLAYLVRFYLNIPFFYMDEHNLAVDFYLKVGAFLIPVWIMIFWFFGLYARQNILGGTREYAKLFNATTMAMFGVIVVNFLVPQFVLARGWLLLTWMFVFLQTAIGRFGMRRVIYFYRTKGYFLTPALIVGANDEAILLANQFQNVRASGLRVMGFIANDIRPGTTLVNDLNVLGPLSQIETLTRELNIEEVIVTSSAISSEEILTIFRLFGLAQGATLRLSSGLYEIITTGLQVQEIASVPLVKVNKIRLTGFDQVMKFLLDYSFSLLAMLAVIPISIVFGILIKLDSKGPVFHRRRVMGVNGRVFDAFKFRTMFVNGDEILEAYPELKQELAQDHKLKHDPRITRVGRLIRKTSLDELPQFFNVLRGEMSVVGPRMISPEEMPEYQQNGLNLLTVKPGITGLWQVSGRSDVSYQQRVRLDMYYIRNWSIWMDFQVIFRTIPAVLSRRGAY